MQIAINPWPKYSVEWGEWSNKPLPSTWLLIDRERGLWAEDGHKVAEFNMTMTDWIASLRSGVLVIGYNLKPLLSENAKAVEIAHDKQSATFIYGKHRGWGPNIRVTPIDGGAAFYRVLITGQGRPSTLLDLRQLGAREPRDLDDMLEVAREALRAHQEHPIDLPATGVVSAGTIVEHYFRAMGVRPLLEKFANIPPEVHEWGMAAYHGGWTDTFATGSYEGFYTDEDGCYPAHMQLLGVPAAVAAQEASWDEPALDLALEELAAHPFVLLEVEPRGHVVPVKWRENSEQEWSTSVASPVTTNGTLWITAWDYILGMVRFDSYPKVVRVVRVKFHGRQGGLRDLEYRGRNISIDNFLPTLIELKREDKATWKTVVNSIYGKFGQVPAGWLTFPIIAACVTAAARLTLGITMSAFEAKGGKVIQCDTDSLFVAGVTREQFDAVRESLACVTSWKWENVNEPGPLYVNALGMKRYQLYGTEGVRDKSDLVIGNYSLADSQLQEAAEYLAGFRELPDWASEPAVIKSMVSIPLYEQHEGRISLFQCLYLRTPRFCPHASKTSSMFCAMDPHSKEWVNIVTGTAAEDIEWRTYADVLLGMGTNAGRKYLTQDGHDPELGYRGLLIPRPVEAARAVRTGRASYRQHDQQIGLYRPEETSQDPWRTVVWPKLLECSTSKLSKLTGLDESTVKRVKLGQVPHEGNRVKLLMAVAELAGKLDYHANPSPARVRAALDALAG